MLLDLDNWALVVKEIFFFCLFLSHIPIYIYERFYGTVVKVQTLKMINQLVWTPKIEVEESF